MRIWRRPRRRWAVGKGSWRRAIWPAEEDRGGCTWARSRWTRTWRWERRESPKLAYCSSSEVQRALIAVDLFRQVGRVLGAVLPPYLKRSFWGQRNYHVVRLVDPWLTLIELRKGWRCECHGVFSPCWDNNNNSRIGSFAYLFYREGFRLEEQGAYIAVVKLSTLYQTLSFTAYSFTITGAVCSSSEAGGKEPGSVPWDELEEKFKKFG